MKSQLKIAGAAIAALLLTSTFSQASDGNRAVLANINQGQYTVSYAPRECSPTVALSVNNRSIGSDGKSSAAEPALVPETIRVGQSTAVTYFRPER